MSRRVTDQMLYDAEQGWALSTETRQAFAAEVRTLRRLLTDLFDPEDCWFDHHGGCQTHGFLSLGPGEQCPHQEAAELIDRD